MKIIKNVILSVILFCILAFFSFLIYKNHFFSANIDLHYTQMQVISKIKVISGDKYEISFIQKNEEICILGRLSCKTKIESKFRVIELLNSITLPRIYFIKKIDDEYEIEIIFQQNSKDVKISDWLKYNKLTYD